MAHNVRTFQPPAVFSQTIGETEINKMDVDITQSVNGDLGGTWAPATPIVFGGSGLHVTGPATLDNILASTLNGVLTVNQPIVPTGVDGFVAPKLQTIGSMAGAINLTETYDTHSFGDPTAAVVATVPYAGGGQPRKKRIYCRSGSLSFEIAIQTVAPLALQALFPPGSNKPWVELLYNGLAWEVCGYGGGTVV